MSTYHLTISTPDGNKFSGDVTRLLVRGTEGDLAVLAGHIPFATAVIACDIKVELPDGAVLTAPAEGGILTVGETEVVLLSSGIDDLK